MTVIVRPTVLEWGLARPDYEALVEELRKAGVAAEIGAPEDGGVEYRSGHLARDTAGVLIDMGRHLGDGALDGAGAAAGAAIVRQAARRLLERRQPRLREIVLVGPSGEVVDKVTLD